MHIATKAHILIVDDVHEVRLSTSRVIEGAGYRVSTASAGLEGLMAVEREQVDLVLLDFNMPGLRGWMSCGRFGKNILSSHYRLSL